RRHRRRPLGPAGRGDPDRLDAALERPCRRLAGRPRRNAAGRAGGAHRRGGAAAGVGSKQMTEMRAMRTWLVATVLAVSASPALAKDITSRLVTTPAALAKEIGPSGEGAKDLVILQVGDKAGYEAGHIPGARLVTLADLAAPMGGEALTLELPDPEALRSRLAALGISDRSRIVVVPTEEGIQSATRVVFTLD